jgi:hypothetical protein
MKRLILFLFFSWTAAIPIAAAAKTGFLVLAPDRGFMGNEEVRDAFEEYRRSFPAAALAVAAREETETFLAEGLSSLEEQKAREIVVLPLFLSEGDPVYQKAKALLPGLTRRPLRFADTLDRSYLTSEILADRLGALSRDPAGEFLVLATDAPGTEGALMSLFHQVHDRFPFAGHAVVLAGRDMKALEAALKDARDKKLKPVLAPFGLGFKMDGMMSFSAGLKPSADRHGAAYDGRDMTPHPNLALWLAKQSNAALPVTEKTLGVVFMPHGATHAWNRTMLDAVAPLQKKYLIEPAFGMADAALIERAVRKLEARGARAIVVLRVFSLEESFRDVTEHVLGLRDHADHAAHGHGGAAPIPAKIRSGSVFYTLGGLEDSPLFAEALLDRAYEISRDPARETVLLVAHGAEKEDDNRHWLENLSRLAGHMKEVAGRRGKRFRDIQFGTWREDWPASREKAVAEIRALVQKAGKNGGTALVIPARTTSAGPEKELLDGLTYLYNPNGFAPHPKFTRWVEEEIQQALRHFNDFGAAKK